MTTARIMYLYAGFLIACGLTAYFRAPPEANAMTALAIPSGAALLMVICGVMASSLHRHRTVGMIGIHAGLGLTLLFVFAFGIRAYGTFNTGGLERRYLAYILAAMTAASIVTFIILLRRRPAKAMRGA